MTTMAIARDNGSGPPVVLLHGFPGNSAHFIPIERPDDLAAGIRSLVAG